ncbi:MAG: glycosyltransferase family 39 protein [Vitreoscilla sp.]
MTPRRPEPTADPATARTDAGRLSANTFGLALAAICALGLLLRLPTLASRSLWLDETYSAWFSALTLHQLWTDVPRYETHPPMYYSMLVLWRALFGASEAALRSLSVLAGVLTIAAVACAGRVLRSLPGRDVAALVAALFLAVNTGSVAYAQQARPYALETLAATLAILAAWSLLERLLVCCPGSSRAVETRWKRVGARRKGESYRAVRRGFATTLRLVYSRIARAKFRDSTLAGRTGARDVMAPAAALAVSTGATLWMHDTGAVVALGIWAGLAWTLLVHTRGQHGRQALVLGAAGLGAVAVFSPFLPLLALQASHVAATAFWVRAEPKDLVAAWYLVTGGSDSTLACFGVLMLAGLATAWRRCRPQALFVAVVLLLPLSAVLAFSFLVKPIFIDRLFEWMTPLAMLVAAIGAVAALPARASAAWRVVAIAITVGLSLKATYWLFAWQREDWRGIVQAIERQARPGDLVVVVPNELSVPLAYYARDPAFPDLLCLPAPFPAQGLQRVYVANLGAPRIAPEDIATLRARLATHGRVWYIDRLADLYDVDDSVRREIAARHALRSTGRSLAIHWSLYD